LNFFVDEVGQYISDNKLNVKPSNLEAETTSQNQRPFLDIGYFRRHGKSCGRHEQKPTK
jgi:hypothetical protein